MIAESTSPGGTDSTRRPAALTERQVAEQLGLSVATLRAWRHAARVRGSCGSDARFGTYPRTWTSSSARAQLTRNRIPRLMMVRSSGSCAYESLETRSAELDRFHHRRPAVSEASAHTNLRVATRRERKLIEEAGHGRLSADEQGPKRLSDAIDACLAAKRIRWSPRTIELEEERLSLVTKHFDDVPLSAITAKAIAEFQHTRHDAGIANRTINMDVGVLSRVLKSCGRWRALADHVKNLPEIGRASCRERVL